MHDSSASVEEKRGSRPPKTGGARFWLGVFLLTTGAGFACEVIDAAVGSYAVPTLLESGLQERYAAVVWAVGPVLGLLFQGYLGSASDRCTSSWGKRRPFILGLAIGVAVCAAVFAYGRPLLFSLGGSLAFLIAMVAFVGMDFTSDQLGTVVMMYLLDSVNLDSSAAAYYVYIIMGGLGSLLGTLICAINWDSMDIGGHVHHSTDWYKGSLEYQLEVVFGFALVIFVVGVLMVLFSVDERRQTDGMDTNLSSDESSSTESSRSSSPDPCVLDNSSKEHLITRQLDSSREVTTEMLVKGPGMPSRPSESGDCDWGIVTSLRRSGEFISCLSTSMKLLWIMAFLDWFVYIGDYIFSTDFVGRVVYGGSPDSDDPDAIARYEAGIRMACWCGLFEDIMTIVYCLSMQWLSGLIGDRVLLVGGHVLQFIALGLTILWPSLPTIILWSTTNAIFISNLETIPYALILYYKDTGKLLGKPWPHRSDLKGKAISLICCSAHLAQIIVALCIGALIDMIGSSSVLLVVLFAACGLGVVASMFVRTSRRTVL